MTSDVRRYNEGPMHYVTIWIAHIIMIVYLYFIYEWNW